MIVPASRLLLLRHQLKRNNKQQKQKQAVSFFHSKVLVANRGEIACRILRTCHKLQIPTVAIYSCADQHTALHAQLATEAYPIGHGPSPSESYLLQDEIIEIALKTNAQAIHPGYGFLSENAEFCRKIQEDAGLTFVGPPASAIQAMGSKQQAKRIMEDAGVPCTPGYSGDDQSPHVLLQQAQEIGFPVLIKAWHGGGGKGMRLVERESDFLSSLQACQREALAAVGDDHVLLEKYLPQPRHVEVQVVADMHGNVVHLHERDCSLQRRHQKIIEEAPASDLDPQLRYELGEMGKRAAQAVGYVNAGTVEFLLDSRDQKYYFCEMNTRLQVEHPITEQITGIDLVEWQLRIAAGQRLPLHQDDIECRGHAMEARIYAENPARGFLPSTGTIWHHAPPVPINTGLDGTTGVRVDSGIQRGQTVGVYYDPMISKLIVQGENRRDAVSKLIQALRQYQIAGVTTNIDFLIECAQHPVFQQAGAIHTGFLEENDIRVDRIQSRKLASGGVGGVGGVGGSSSPLAQAVASYAVTLWLENRLVQDDKNNNNNNNSVINNNNSIGKSLPSSSSKSSPWSSHSGSWRMGGPSARARRKLILDDNGSFFMECISNRDGSVEVLPVNYNNNNNTSTSLSSTTTASSANAVADAGESAQPATSSSSNSTSIHVSGTWNADNGMMDLIIDKTKRLSVTCILREENEWIRLRMWPHYSYSHHHHDHNNSTNNNNLEEEDDYVWEFDIRHPLYSSSSSSSSLSPTSKSGGMVYSPMPGRIRRLNVASGDVVKQGDVVVVMEAMKMEHSIKAPCNGKVTELTSYKVGDVVEDGALLFIVVVEEDDDDSVVDDKK